ncbi:MAG: YegP family protein [Mycolicibacterium sp.]|nr:YegP family protein [Mycolicibacterium sp.]
MAGKFEISKDHAGKFRFHLKAANGEIIATSQGYGTKESAKKGIESVKENASSAKVEDLTEAREGAKPTAKPTPRT